MQEQNQRANSTIEKTISVANIIVYCEVRQTLAKIIFQNHAPRPNFGGTMRKLFFCFLYFLVFLAHADAQSVEQRNAEFAARIHAYLLKNAAQAAEHLNQRANQLRDLSQRINDKAELSDSDRTILLDTFGDAFYKDIKYHRAVTAATIAKTSNSAENLASHVRALSNVLESTSPQQTVQLLGAGVKMNELNVIFPEQKKTKDYAFVVAPNTQSDPISLYTRAGAFGDGGPIVSYDSVSLILRVNPHSGQFEPWCTGTLIASRKILTAAHCFCPEPELGEVTRNTCLSDGKKTASDPNRYRVFFQRAGLFQIADLDVHPGFVLRTDASGKREDIDDIAIITLSADIEGVPFSVIDVNASAGPGTSSEIVGFGAGFAPDAPGVAPAGLNPSDPGLKLWASVSLAACHSPFSSPAYLCWNSGPTESTRSGAICGGDSGGPMYAANPDESTIVSNAIMIGVNIAGTVKDCSKLTSEGDANLGLDVIRDFIRQNIGAAPPETPPKTVSYLHQAVDFLSDNGIYSPSFSTDRPLRSLVVAVNGFASANFSMQLIDDKGTDLCVQEGGTVNNLPGVDACRITNVRAHSSLKVVVRGTGSAALQLVASGIPE